MNFSAATRNVRVHLRKQSGMAKGGHEMELAGEVKEISKKFYRYIKNKRVASERIGHLIYLHGCLCVEHKRCGN